MAAESSSAPPSPHPSQRFWRLARPQQYGNNLQAPVIDAIDNKKKSGDKEKNSVYTLKVFSALYQQIIQRFGNTISRSNQSFLELEFSTLQTTLGDSRENIDYTTWAKRVGQVIEAISATLATLVTGIEHHACFLTSDKARYLFKAEEYFKETVSFTKVLRFKRDLDSHSDFKSKLDQAVGSLIAQFNEEYKGLIRSNSSPELLAQTRSLAPPKKSSCLKSSTLMGNEEKNQRTNRPSLR